MFYLLLALDCSVFRFSGSMTLRGFVSKGLLVCSAALLSGCSHLIKNDTPAQVPQNASELYTIEMSLGQTGENVLKDECFARVIIDGEIHRMTRTGESAFSYDYKRPDGQHNANYYFELDYKTKSDKKIYNKFERSKLYKLAIVNRYIVGLECNRGLPGSKITLLGRGFESGDYVEIDGVSCETKFVSPNSLHFVVPMLGRTGKFHVKLVSDNGDIELGTFHVDRVSVSADTSSIELLTGEKQAITISIGTKAPDEGVMIDVTTNIPDSIIMKDVFIPAGESSAIAVIEGADAGSGFIYLTAGGFNELQIPVEVISASSNNVDDIVKQDDILDE